MAGFGCKAMLLIFPCLGASLVVDSSNATGAVDDIADADADSLDQPDGYSNNFAVDDIGYVSFIAPEKGDAVPAFPLTFPGCSCEWNEGYKKGWSCESDILAPESMEGKPCCCCTTSCLAEHRCSNDECMLLGIDQAAGVAAEASAKAKRAKEKAIPDIGDAQITKVRQPPGLCTHSSIWAACKKIGQVPLCNNFNIYQSRDRGKPGCRAGNTCDNNHNCWFPFMGGSADPTADRNTNNKEWQWTGFDSVDKMTKKGINPLKLGGTCIYAFNGGTSQAIMIRGTADGIWTPQSAAQSINFRYTNLEGEGTAADLNRKGWETWCVNKKPLPYAKGGYNGPR